MELKPTDQAACPDLIEFIPEPYASMVFMAVLTGLRVSELIGLKWRCIHSDSISVAQRYFRGDWSVPKTQASAATIGVSPAVIARILRLKTLSVEVRAGRAVRIQCTAAAFVGHSANASCCLKWAKCSRRTVREPPRRSCPQASP